MEDSSQVPEDWNIALLTLAEAVIRGRTDLVGLLLKRHTTSLAAEKLPTDQISVHCTPGDNTLHLACRLNQVDCVRALLRSGMPISIRNSENELALSTATVPAIKQAFYMELLQNVCAGNVDRVRELLHGGLRAGEMDSGPDGTTLLHWGASLGQGGEMARVLIEGGAEVNAKSKQGRTALDEAHASGNTAFAQALQEALGIATASLPAPPPVLPQQPLQPLSQRKIEEQDSLIDTLRQTIDQLLRENGVRDHVTRLQDHVGALTRQLAATAEQRDKLQNLYVTSDRELERLARELATKSHPAITSKNEEDDDGGGEEEINVSAWRERVRQLNLELEKERQDGYAAVRMHLTYEADLRAEIKALHEQLLLTTAVAESQDDNGGVKPASSSFFPSLW
ncbi:hypothetical protein BASA81_013748 [Batrachochytrium salamandrivorans]|nr:hypothetical protein BASA81_013748 [Batrachochytrium salamandrivorans]